MVCHRASKPTLGDVAKRVLATDRSFHSPRAVVMNLTEEQVTAHTTKHEGFVSVLLDRVAVPGDDRKVVTDRSRRYLATSLKIGCDVGSCRRLFVKVALVS